ncbi:ABC transporter substrate-binding protein [Lacisediminimonas sp.]|uniref:ABC transporter substrate-binding protein n=1 Tax=Lacisediminimonas sp. TaxID=3060582 RepID=UPI002728242F|nr:ABC transporter substrate-binding protein [Lacisediminimonas sp.]MDO8298714.1 ABC transporter substrate-binding protein [Lacisediminimonas sp.]
MTTIFKKDWLVTGALSMLLAVSATAIALPAHAQAGKPLQVIRLADQPSAEVSYTVVWVAEAMGYFADEGIRIERKTYANGPAALLEFANGSLDAVMAAVAPFMQFAARGGDFKMVVSLTKGNSALVGLKKYKSYADLNGKKVGVPGLGTTHDAVLSYAEQSQNLKFQRVFGKITDIAVMVEKGEVDAYIGWEPASAMAIAQNPKLHYIAQLPPIKNVESLEMIVQTKLAKENPELVYGFVRAIRRGIEYTKNNPKEKIAEIIVKKMGDPKATPVIMSALDSVILNDPRVDMPSFRILMNTIAKQGKIPAELVKDTDGWIGKYLDYSFLDRAERSLGLAK